MLLEQVGQSSRCHYAKGDLTIILSGVVHGRRIVNQDVAPEVSFLFVPFGKQLIGTGIYFPIDISGAFPGVVKFMLGKFNRKPMVGGFMKSGDKAFHQLPGE